MRMVITCVYVSVVTIGCFYMSFSCNNVVWLICIDWPVRSVISLGCK